MMRALTNSGEIEIFNLNSIILALFVYKVSSSAPISAKCLKDDYGEYHSYSTC